MTRLLAAFLCVLSSEGALADPASSMSAPVYLDHVVVTVSRATYETIGSSTFLGQEFAAVAIDTITTSDDAWTGTYVSGQHTYIEFFCNSAPAEPPSSGIGFSVERSGGVAAIAATLSDVWGERVQTELCSGPTMPWYYTASVDTSDAFSSWVMEYHPAFTEMVRRSASGAASKDSSPELDGAGPLRREEMMAGDFDSRLLLGDLTGVDVALDEPRRSQFLEELRLYGYELEEVDGVVTATGPDATLRVEHVSSGRRGVTAIRMRLLRAPGAKVREHTFGTSSRLVLSDTEALWIFDE